MSGGVTGASVCAAPTPPALAAPHPGAWAVDPAAPGENVPPVGRSLFDFLMVRRDGGEATYDVPFPFAALMNRLENGLDRSHGLPLKAVLIPLGRSLQRTAAAPEFFTFPRVVVAADAEPRSAGSHAGVLLKDRIYLGYQEKQNLIEVISYNESAGRFEFQVVKDYRAGGKPQVLYANRAICTACHQNAAPLFSRQVWDETNANPRIAALLRKQKRSFYGIDPDRGVDVPNAIDDATDRANLFATYQLLWRAGCGSAADQGRARRCRARLFVAALQYRLSGQQHFDDRSQTYRENVLEVFAAAARSVWRDGLRIPNPDIPNRDPFMARSAMVGDAAPGREGAVRTSFAENADVLAAFDPLAPRPPLEVWSLSEEATLKRLVAGLGEFLAESDVRQIDARLVRLSLERKAPKAAYAFDCRTLRIPKARGAFRVDFDCALESGTAERGAALRGRLYGEATRITGGRLDRLKLAEGTDRYSQLTDIDVAHGVVARAGERSTVMLRLSRAGAHARRADGNRIDALELTWTGPSWGATSPPAASARAQVHVVMDFDPAERAIAKMESDGAANRLDVFSEKPFRRASLMPALFERLGMRSLTWCCVDESAMPPALMESHTTAAGARTQVDARPGALQPFYRYCATCHQSSDRSPPNFLQGSAAQVSSNLAHCAQRLYVRLSMWKTAPEERPKTPMPPYYALQGMHVSAAAWRDSSELAALRSYVERALNAEAGKPPSVDELMARGYENLRPCVP